MKEEISKEAAEAIPASEAPEKRKRGRPPKAAPKAEEPSTPMVEISVEKFNGLFELPWQGVTMASARKFRHPMVFDPYPGDPAPEITALAHESKKEAIANAKVWAGTATIKMHPGVAAGLYAGSALVMAGLHVFALYKMDAAQAPPAVPPVPHRPEENVVKPQDTDARLSGSDDLRSAA